MHHQIVGPGPGIHFAFRVIRVLLIAIGLSSMHAAPFTVEGPGVDPGNFHVTVFASGLSFPVGMAELPDGSIIATISEGASFFNSSGKLIRLVDDSGDGVSDGVPQVMASGLAGTLTAVKIWESVVVATSAGGPMVFFRLGDPLSDPLVPLGQIDFSYPGGSTYHAHSALELRPTPGVAQSFDLFFQVGSEANFATSTGTVPFESASIPGASGVLSRDSAYMMTITYEEDTLSMTNLVRIGSGLRNAAGFALHPTTGDLYLQDNGIDGLVDANEPHSADELNVIRREQIGKIPEPFFGFPDNHTKYRTGEVVGGEGVWPIMVFQPIPDPFTGRRSEGPNDITFAPPGFPEGLNRGMFIGFHGKFNFGGTQNDENPVIYADPETGASFHFIAGQQLGIGHMNGLLACRNALYVADMTATGSMVGTTPPAGVIYRIQATTPAVPPHLRATLHGEDLELRWDRGQLLEADSPGGPWTRPAGAFSPWMVKPSTDRLFFRAGY